jgi:lysozyme
MPKPLVLDLSHHQEIPHDLNDTRAAGIAAIIHKATEGTKFVDGKVRARYSLAKDAGMLWGLYHFLKPPKKTAGKTVDRIVDQADHFLTSAIWDSASVLVCDFEVEGISLNQVLEFLEYVEKESNQQPALYSGFLLKQLGGASKLTKLADYRLWLAQYGPRAVLPKGYDRYWLWQYTEKGTIPGVSGSVDLNTYNGTEEELKRDWVIRHSTAASINSASSDEPVANVPKVNEESASPTESEQPSNTSTLKAEITAAGNVTVEKSNGTPVPKERIAVVAAEKQKWTARVSAKVTGAVTGNIFFQWVWAQLEKISGLGIPTVIWIIVSSTIGIGTLLWLAHEILESYQYNKRQERLDELLVSQNSTPENLAQLIPADEVEIYRAKGFKIITRGEKAA